jgi:hypothetical protein
MGLRPTNELVAVAWLNGVTGITSGKVATSLPKDATSWASTGFVRVAAVGGSTNPHVPLIAPALQIDCWANGGNSDKPPWGQANALAEAIRAACYDTSTVGRTLTLPTGYDIARVRSAYLLGEPVRRESDESSYARYQFDLQLAWVAAR